MKLKTKLLPLLTIGASAAVATPLMVSCGGNTTSNLYEIYIPTIPKAISSRILDPAEATVLYGDHLLLNSEIFIQDVKCYDSFIAKELYESYFGQNPMWAASHNPIIDMQTQISNLSVEFTKEAQAAFLYPTLSFDLTGKINLDANQMYFQSSIFGQFGEQRFHHVEVDSFRLHVQGLPIRLWWQSSTWFIESAIYSPFVYYVPLYPWSVKCEIGNTTVVGLDYFHSFIRDAQTYTLTEDNLPAQLEEVDQNILDFVWNCTIGMQFVYHMSDITGWYDVL